MSDNPYVKVIILYESNSPPPSLASCRNRNWPRVPENLDDFLAEENCALFWDGHGAVCNESWESPLPGWDRISLPQPAVCRNKQFWHGDVEV